MCQPLGFCHQSACGGSLLHFAYLRLKNGSPFAPFSASSFDILCQDSTKASPACVLTDFCQQVPSLSASGCLTSCLSHHCEGSTLPILHLSSSYGPSKRPFSVTNFAITGSTCPSSRLSPEIEGFCLQFLALSSLCGGSTPPIQLWSSNSSTLRLRSRILHCTHRTAFQSAHPSCTWALVHIFALERTTLSSGVLCP